MISIERVNEIHAFNEKHGNEETIKQFDINEETLDRYLRLYASMNGDNIFGAKILTFDIETSPSIGAFWSPWKTNISPAQMLRDWHLLTWSAKWLGKKDVMHDRCTSKEAIAGDDKRIVKSLRDLIDAADIVIAHNGKKFDVKKLNTRMILNKIERPSPYTVVDTLQEVKKVFSFTYNRLDYLVKTLELNEGKTDTNMQLWLDCIRGDAVALKKMDEYCQNDVYILEELYLNIRGWIKGHPNIALYNENNDPQCHVCGSDNITDTGRYKITQVGKYSVYKCNKCGAFSVSRKSEITRDKKDSLLKSF